MNKDAANFSFPPPTSLPPPTPPPPTHDSFPLSAFPVFGLAAVGWVDAQKNVARAGVARALLIRRCPGICLVRANLVLGYV